MQPQSVWSKLTLERVATVNGLISELHIHCVTRGASGLFLGEFG